MRMISHDFNPANPRSVKNLHRVLNYLSDRAVELDRDRGALGRRTAALVAEVTGRPVATDALDAGSIDAGTIDALNRAIIDRQLAEPQGVRQLHDKLALVIKKKLVRTEPPDRERERGEMGPATREAILAFQRKYRLQPTGKMDPATERRLTSVFDSIAGSRPHPKARLKVRRPEGLTPVVNYLRLNMTGPRIVELQRALSFLGHEILQEEHRAAVFGRSTRNALEAFQASVPLPVTGRTDGPTVRALNRRIMLANPALADAPRGRVRGSVRNADWIGVPRGRLRLRRLDTDEVLAERQTFGDGFFDILYEIPRTKTGTIVLALERLDANGRVFDTRKLYDPARISWANFTDGDVPYGGPSLWEQVRKAVSPVLEQLGIGPTDLEESERRQDFSLLSRTTKLPPDSLLRYALAHRVSAELAGAATPTVLFGLFAADLPPELPGDPFPDERDEWDITIPSLVSTVALAVGLLPADVQRQGLEEALALNAIPRSEAGRTEATMAALETLRERMVLERPLLVGDGTLSELIDVAGIPAQLRSTVAQSFLRSGGLTTAFLDDLRSAGTPDASIDALDKTIQLGVIARNHPAMLRTLAAENAQPRALAKLDRADWAQKMRAEGIDPPDFQDATNTDERIEMYAASLAEHAERLYPDIAMLAAVRRAAHPVVALDDVIRVVDAHPELDLAEQNLARFNEASGQPLSDEALGTARALQRIRRIAPNAQAAAAMIESGLLGALDVVRFGEDRVAQMLSDRGVPHLTARALVTKATSRHNEIVAKLSQYRFDFLKGNPVVLPDFTYSQAEIDAIKAEIPDIEALFGSVDFCDCPAATSLYSPAAYLTDILRFLGAKSARAAGRSVLDVLVQRRPDIVRIKLNDANTNTPVPYIDLINELLENLVPPAVPNFDPQTTRPAEHLVAAPEHLRIDAYDTLRDAPFPIHSSFNLWRARTRAFLSFLSVPRHEVMRVFAARPGLGTQAPTEAQIGAEFFAISRQDLERIAPAAPQADVARQDEYWGFPTDRTRIPVREFLDKSGLDYSGLLELIDSRFPDPGPNPIGISRPFADCDIEKQEIEGLSLARFDRIHRFLRLKRHTQWQIWELALLLRDPAVGGGSLDRNAVAALAAIARLQSRLSLDVEKVLAMFGPLNTVERRSPDAERRPIAPLYMRVFQNELIAVPTPATFTLPLQPVGILTVANDFIGPLQVDSADVERLAALTDGQVSHDSLATMYRWSMLARARRMPIRALLNLRLLVGAPTMFADPFELVAFLDDLDSLDGIRVEELNYLLTAAPDSPLGLRDETITRGLELLRGRLATATDEQRPQGEDPRTTLTRLLPRRPELADPDELARALDLIDGRWTATEAERLAFIAAVFDPFAGGADVAARLTVTGIDIDGPLTAAQEADIAARRAFVLDLLRLAVSRNLIAQWASERFVLDAASTAVLLDRFVMADARPMIAHFLDQALVARDGEGDFVAQVSRATFGSLFIAATWLHKTSLFVAPHILEADEIAWLIDRGAAVGALSPAALPVAADPPQPLFERLQAFTQLMAFRGAFPAPEGETLFTALDQALDPARSADDVEGVLASLVQRPIAELSALRTLLGLVHPANPQQRDYARPVVYARLQRALALANRLGTPSDVIERFARFEPQNEERGVAQAASDAAKSKFGDADWLSRLQQIENPLRERRRDALLAFLIERSQRNEPRAVVVAGETVRNVRHWRTPTDATRYLLIDVEMSACQPTSRIRQAISAVQMFVQRCFLNREQEFVSIPAQDPDLTNSWTQWRWRKSYRIWEANRKILFYPENWIRPELRDDKTPFFLEFEGDALQNELTAESAEQAYRNYLEKLREVANIKVLGVFEELPPPSKRFHVVGRSRAAPHSYYYRFYNFDYGTWSAWERIDADIKGDHAIPVIYNRRLHVFWLEIDEKPEKVHRNPAAALSEKSRRNPEPGRVLEIKLGWTERKSDGWTAKRLSDRPLIHPWTRPHYSYHLRPRYKPADNLLWVDVFVSTSREFNDTTFLAQGGDNYAYSYRTKTRYNQTYRPWHSSSFVFDGSVRRILMRGMFAHYFFPKDEKTRYVSSWDYVHTNFGAEGRAIEELVAPNRRSSARRPTGMHYEFNQLVNNDANAPNSRRVNVHSSTLQTERLMNNAGSPFAVVLPPQGGGGPSMVYQDPARSYFAKHEVRQIIVDYQVRENRVNYRLFPFFHPYTDLFIRELNRSGLDGLLNRKIQVEPDSFYPHNDFNFASYAPTSLAIVDEAAQVDIVDFSFGGAYSIYNWELFFHIPFYLAIRLAENQKFEAAFEWFYRCFNPTSTDDAPSPQRYWITKPFFEHTAADYRRQRVDALVANADAFRDVITAWANDPFKPHLVARYRPVAYQRAVFMRFLDAVIAQGNHEARAPNLEAANQAVLSYLFAAELLGELPVRVPAIPRADRSFAELLQEGELDLLGNADVLAQVDSIVGPSTSFLPPGANPAPIGDLTIPYFCLPPNDALLGYWEKVSTLLFNLRNCRTVEGAPLVRSVFAPPIDPALFVKAAAAGADLDSVMSRLGAPGPAYRCLPILRFTRTVCSEVQRLSDRFIMALERRDAEELAQLRADNAAAIQRLRREVLDLRVSDALGEVAALRASRVVTSERARFYNDRERVSELEGHALRLSWASVGFDAAIALGYILAGGLALIPSFVVGASGFGGSPHVVSEVTSGEKISSSAENAVKTLSAIAHSLEKVASAVRTRADLNRRAEEWSHQATIATLELTQIDQRIAQADVRVALAEKERANLDKEIDAAESEAAYLTDKFTNKDLFAWMIGQISTVYFDAYQLCYDLALQAERAYQLELGEPSASFVRFGHWDSLRKGLVAGDRLMHDINRMEAAYLERHRREYEITRHVSLARIAPLAFLQLRLAGETTFDLPEWLFDMDYPGHYFRRIKSIALSIPSVIGPYGSINATLSLVSSRVRISPMVDADYAEQPDDPRFVTEFGTVRSIATSRGVEDAGLFRLDFDDPRFLPFETAGAVSAWHLAMRPQNNQFNFSSLSDVILHVRYTARDGGGHLRNAAQQRVDAVLPRSGVLMVSARTEFPDVWHRFRNPDPGSENVLVFDLERARFPFFARDRAITAASLDVVVLGAGAGSYEVRIAAPGEAAGSVVPSGADTTLGGWPRARRTLPARPAGTGRWTLAVRETGAGDFASLPADALGDVFLLMAFELA